MKPEPVKPQDGYILDAEDPTEMARLIAQAKAMTETLRSLVPGELDLSTMDTILDIGCGPGVWVLDVAQRSTARVIGIDISQRMLNYAAALARVWQLDNALFYSIDATQPLDWPDRTFDLINARFLTSFMKKESWFPLAMECFRLLKPGGSLVFTEGDLAITNSEALDQIALWLNQLLLLRGSSFSPLGRTPGVIAMLKYFLQQAGFVDVEQESYLMDGSAGEDKQLVWQEDLIYFLQMLKSTIIRVLNVPEKQFEAVLEQLYVDQRQPDFRNITPVVVAWGTKPL